MATATTARIPYEILGTLTDTPQLTVCAARKTDSDELLLLNRIPHDQDTRDLFRDLYFYSAHRPERSEFVELYSADRDFYAVFKYHQAPSLASLYGSCPGPTARRLSILIDALFRVYNDTLRMPLPVVCSALQPDNILIDDDGNIRIFYQLQAEFLTDSQCSLWNEAASLVQFMLARELFGRHHQALQDICKKCRAGLYPSLPALINDLEKAAQTLEQAEWLYRIKSFVLRKKARILQMSWLSLVAMASFLVIYLVTELTRTDELPAAAISDIGNITYVAAQDEEDSNLQLTDPSQPQTSGSEPAFSSLPLPTSELSSEDYIVQSGDTLESICLAKYGAEAYAAAVASFNGLAEDAVLDAGSVLLLPLRDQLAAYIT